MAQELKNITTIFIKKEKVAHETYSFYFKKPARFSYVAGQCMKITLQDVRGDNRGPRRFFTISSSPLDEELMITTKIIKKPSMFKQRLFSLEQGNEVTIFGPMGTFFLPDESNHPLIFLAGGIGVTPFHSMITYATSINYPTQIYLFASFSSVEEAVFYKDFVRLSKENLFVKIIYTITHPGKSREKWQGEVGRISPGMIKKYIPEFKNYHLYICGPEKMVDEMFEMMKSVEITQGKIRKEQFSGY
ncbi:MAG: FAD-dependent oxidoreductase [Candidatus Levybacteria bacterium]|nr:FAD-dependent oxidoreductase [Candidatus Levybacteria bacterium]